MSRLNVMVFLKSNVSMRCGAFRCGAVRCGAVLSRWWDKFDRSTVFESRNFSSTVVRPNLSP